MGVLVHTTDSSPHTSLLHIATPPSPICGSAVSRTQAVGLALGLGDVT